MVKYNTCIRCFSNNIDRLAIKSNIGLYYPEQTKSRSKYQRRITPTDTLVCKRCGHIEFIFDWDKSNQ